MDIAPRDGSSFYSISVRPQHSYLAPCIDVQDSLPSANLRSDERFLGLLSTQYRRRNSVLVMVHRSSPARSVLCLFCEHTAPSRSTHSACSMCIAILILERKLHIGWTPLWATLEGNDQRRVGWTLEHVCTIL